MQIRYPDTHPVIIRRDGEVLSVFRQGRSCAVYYSPRSPVMGAWDLLTVYSTLCVCVEVLQCRTSEVRAWYLPVPVNQRATKFLLPRGMAWLWASLSPILILPRCGRVLDVCSTCVCFSSLMLLKRVCLWGWAPPPPAMGHQELPSTSPSAASGLVNMPHALPSLRRMWPPVAPPPWHTWTAAHHPADPPHYAKYLTSRVSWCDFRYSQERVATLLREIRAKLLEDIIG